MGYDSGKGLRFTQRRAQELILAVATPGVWFSKADVEQRVVEKHRNNGGILSGNTSEAVRKGLQRPAKEGKLRHNGLRSRASQYIVSAKVEPNRLPTSKVPTGSAMPKPDEADLPTGDRVAGSPESGHGYIYVICETTHEPRQHTRMVKVGRSDRLTNQRVSQLVNAGAPGTRRCGLIYYTEEPAEYEAVLHRLLKAKGRHIEGKGGTEWFWSSPREVERLLNILKSLVPELDS